jgi:hypothetical protein
MRKVVRMDSLTNSECKNVQLLNIKLESKVKDFMGVWEVGVLINGKAYTYSISSEWAVEEFERLLRKRKPGRALKVLNQFKLEGFNSFKEEK